MEQNPMNYRSDSTLLMAWRSGNTNAGNALLERHYAPLRRFLRNRVGAHADELLQRTFLACIESHQRIRGDSSFRTYLYTIARNELCRLYRQRHLHGRFVDIDDCVLRTPEVSAFESQVCVDSRRALSGAVLRLPERDRALLDMAYLEELDSMTLSAALGIKPTSVRSRLHRVRKELRSALSSGTRQEPREGLLSDKE